MKVSELEIGMMVKPAGDSEIFLVVGPFGNDKVPYVTIKTASRIRPMNFAQSAMYLGQRKDVFVNKDQMGWSDRYLLIGEQVVAVDPSAWRRMKEV